MLYLKLELLKDTIDSTILLHTRLGWTNTLAYLASLLLLKRESLKSFSYKVFFLVTDKEVKKARAFVLGEPFRLVYYLRVRPCAYPRGKVSAWLHQILAQSGKACQG